MTVIRKSVVLALVAGAFTLSAGAAQAAHWSVGINLPLPLPVFVAPAPVYSAPAPYYAPAPV